jgi:hypothetical protein
MASDTNDDIVSLLLPKFSIYNLIDGIRPQYIRDPKEDKNIGNATEYRDSKRPPTNMPL